MSSFSERYNLSNVICSKLQSLFPAEEVEIIPFGVESISEKSESLKAYISSQEVNESWSGMWIKFAPDFILLKKSFPQAVYFWEVKVSQTPLWATGNFEEIKARYPNIRLSDVGDIAREAWNAYNNLFPNTIILDACTYNSNLFVAQFVKNIRCVRCFLSAQEAADCSHCPMKNGDLFPFARNSESTGSKTPHTNLDLSSFCQVVPFFHRLGINVNGNVVEEIKQQIMDIGVCFPDKVYPIVQERIRKILRAEGCLWA